MLLDACYALSPSTCEYKSVTFFIGLMNVLLANELKISLNPVSQIALTSKHVWKTRLSFLILFEWRMFIPGEFRSYLKVWKSFFLGAIIILGVDNHYNVQSTSYISEDALNSPHYQIMKTEIYTTLSISLLGLVLININKVKETFLFLRVSIRHLASFFTLSIHPYVFVGLYSKYHTSTSTVRRWKKQDFRGLRKMHLPVSSRPALLGLAGVPLLNQSTLTIVYNNCRTSSSLQTV